MGILIGNSPIFPGTTRHFERTTHTRVWVSMFFKKIWFCLNCHNEKKNQILFATPFRIFKLIETSLK